MSNIKVFSDARKFAEGGEWSIAAADIVANFPACKMLFHEDDIVSGDTTWACRVNPSLILTASAGFTKTSLGVYGIVTSIAGLLPVIGDLSPMLIWRGSGVLTLASSNFRVGANDTTVGIDIYTKPSAAQYSVADTAGANYAKLTSGAFANPIGEGCFMNNNENNQDTNAKGVSTLSIAKSGAASYNSGGVMTGAGVFGTWDILPQTLTIPSSSVSGAKFLALMCFTNGVPSAQAVLANEWMAEQAGLLSPTFAGRS